MFNKINLIFLDDFGVGGERRITNSVINLLKKHKRINFLKKDKFPGRSFFYTSYATKAFFLLLIKKNVIFHYHGTKSSKFSGIYKNPIKLVSFYFLHCLKSFFKRVTEYYVKRYATIVIVVSTNEYLTLKKMRRNKQLFFLPSYVDTDNFTFYKRKWRKIPIVGYLGRITLEKGVIELVQAATLLKDKIEFLHITHITGHNDHLLRKIKKIAKKGKVPLKVFNNLDEKKVVKYLANLDLLVLPSYSEEFPLIMLEAFASGTPFIATNVGECGRLLSKVDSRLIIDSYTPKDISNKISWFFSLSTKERNVLIDKAKKASEDYSLAIFKKKLFSIFDDIFLYSQKISKS